jgi:hypothetical protein
MKVQIKYLIYALVVVLFILGSFYLVKEHPEVQFIFYIPGVALVLFAVISDDLLTKQSEVRQLRGK